MPTAMQKLASAHEMAKNVMARSIGMGVDHLCGPPTAGVGLVTAELAAVASGEVMARLELPTAAGADEHPFRHAATAIRAARTKRRPAQEKLRRLAVVVTVAETFSACQPGARLTSL